MDMTKFLNGETSLWKQERVLFFDEHYNVGRPPWQSLRILVRRDLECSSIGIVCCSCTEIVHFDFAKERWATVAADASGRSHYLHRRNSATCSRCKFALCFVVINLHWCIFCFLGRTSIDQLMFFGQRRLAIQSLCPVPAIMHYWKQSAACRTTELDSLFCGPMRRFQVKFLCHWSSADDTSAALLFFCDPYKALLALRQHMETDRNIKHV